MERKELPHLFCIDAAGKKRVWKCYVVGNKVFREYGLVSGKKVTSHRAFDIKCEGNKNETSPEEQAWIEANKEWVRRIDKGYSPSEDDQSGIEMVKRLRKEKSKHGGHNINSVAASGARSVKKISRKKSETLMVDEVQGGPVIPMKATKWILDNNKDPYSVASKVLKYFSTKTGRGKKAVIKPVPIYGQPKLDGWRARVMIQNNPLTGKKEISITTNSGKQYPWFKSLREKLLEWLTSEGMDERYIMDGLDGELFTFKFPRKSRFSTIQKVCSISIKKPHELEGDIQFHVFDLIDKSGTVGQKDRFERLSKLFELLPPESSNTIIKVPTKILDSYKEVPQYHEECVGMGYEGAVIRTFTLKYTVGKRSLEMRKFKYMEEDEYKVVGCSLDKGVSKEHFVWICETAEGKTFSAKPEGSEKEKAEWFENKDALVGRMLTVKYQELTEDGIPRFPIAKAFRAGKGID